MCITPFYIDFDFSDLAESSILKTKIKIFAKPKAG